MRVAVFLSHPIVSLGSSLNYFPTRGVLAGASPCRGCQPNHVYGLTSYLSGERMLSPLIGKPIIYYPMYVVSSLIIIKK